MMTDDLDRKILRMLRGEDASGQATVQVPAPTAQFVRQIANLNGDYDDDDGDYNMDRWIDQERVLELTTAELICSLPTIDPMPSGVSLLSMRVPGLKEELEKSVAVADKIKNYLGISVEYRCKYCGEIVRTSGNRCCPNIDTLLSARSRIHTIIAANVETQLKEIVTANFDEILNIRKEGDQPQSIQPSPNSDVDGEWAKYVDHLVTMSSNPPTLSSAVQANPPATSASMLTALPSAALPPTQQSTSAICGRQRRRAQNLTVVEQLTTLMDAPATPWQLFPIPLNSRQAQPSAPPTRLMKDIHQSRSYLDSIESKVDRDQLKKIKLSLNFCCDGYPMYGRGRGSAVPVLLQVLDLGARSRSKPHNFALAYLIGGKGKAGAELWERLLPHLKRTIENLEIEVRDYKCSFRISSASIDADCVRELYEFKGWTAYTGCFRCYAPGVRSSGAVRFPPSSRPPTERTIRSLKEDAEKRTNGFSRYSLVHEFVSMKNIKIDSLHVIDEGILKDICRGLMDPKSIFYLGAFKRILEDILITVPSGYVKPRSVTEGMLTATEYNIHGLTTIVLLALEDYIGDNANVSMLLFAMSTSMLFVRKRNISDIDQKSIRQMFDLVEKEIYKIGGARVFTWKMHTFMHHIPNTIDRLGVPDDSTMAPMEAINRQIDLRRNQSSSRGYEEAQMTRFLARSFVLRRLHSSNLTDEERAQAAVIFPELSMRKKEKIDDNTYLTHPIRGKPGLYRTIIQCEHSYSVGDIVCLTSGERGQLASIQYSNRSIIMSVRKYRVESVIPMLLRIAPRGKFITSFLALCYAFINSTYCTVDRRSSVIYQQIDPKMLQCKCFKVAFASFNYDIIVTNNSRYRHE